MQIDRRAILASAATAGFAATLAACRTSGGTAGKEKDVSANEDLMREHGVLRRVLIVYREVAPKIAAGQSLDVAALASAAALFRDFGEAYHEKQLEEQYIFPELHKGPNAALVDTLLAQHQRGREITGFVLDTTKDSQIASGRTRQLASSMVEFARMYEAHTAREDTIIFPAFKAALSEGQLDELSDRFEDIEHRQFGKGGFDDAVGKIADIEGRLGLADLAAFTAPPVGAAAKS
jgi:hemerythrin-like domain-containing protein